MQLKRKEDILKEFLRYFFSHLFYFFERLRLQYRLSRLLQYKTCNYLWHHLSEGLLFGPDRATAYQQNLAFSEMNVTDVYMQNVALNQT